MLRHSQFIIVVLLISCLTSAANIWNPFSQIKSANNIHDKGLSDFKSFDISKNPSSSQRLYKDNDDRGVMVALIADICLAVLSTFLVRGLIKVFFDNFQNIVVPGESSQDMCKIDSDILQYLLPNTTITQHEFEVARLGFSSPNRSNFAFGNIGGLKLIKASLTDTVEDILECDTNSPNRFSLSSGILLYGPPGCGKTALVKSLGNWANVPLISVTPSLLLRKYVGESPQLVRAVFSLAKKLQPCIIFVDEMDSLFRTRVEDDSAVDRNLKTEFLQLWDDLVDSRSKVLILGATNRPQDLDAAALRRFERSFLVGLPDEGARKEVLDVLLRDVEKETGFSMRLCAKMTEGYAPSDLVALCKAAASIPIREHKRKSEKNSIRPLRVKDIQLAMQGVFPAAWAAQSYGSPAGGPRSLPGTLPSGAAGQSPPGGPNLPPPKTQSPSDIDSYEDEDEDDDDFE